MMNTEYSTENKLSDTLKFELMSKDVKGRPLVSSTGRQAALVLLVKAIGLVSSKIATSYSSVLMLK